MALLAPLAPLAHRVTFLAALSLFALTGAGCLGSGKSSGGADGGVFKSVDAGTEWVQATAIPSAKGVGTIGGTDVIALEMDPGDNLAVYAGTAANGLLYSLDGAASWTQPREAGLKEGTVAAVGADPTDSCTVYVAKGQRLFKTEDCLRTFDAEAYVETRVGVTVTEVDVDWYNPLTVWIGLSNGDVLKSEDGGDKWQTVLSADKEITALAVSGGDSRTVLVGTVSDGFHRTADGGAAWTHVKGDLKELKNAAKVTAFVQDRSGSTVVAATAYGLIRSKDFGATWEPLQLLSSPGQVEILALAMDPADANEIMYAAGSTFYLSVDGGAKWTTSKIPTARVPQAMLYDPSAEAVYLGVAALEE